MWQYIHASFIFKSIPLKKKWMTTREDKEWPLLFHHRRHSFLASVIVEIHVSFQLFLPMLLFWKTDQPWIRTQKTNKNRLLSRFVCSGSPPAGGEIEFSLGGNRTTIWPLKWQRKIKSSFMKLFLKVIM